MRFFVVIFFLFPSVLFATTTSEFTINALVGDDAIPPTTPTLLTAVPTAPTQIDVTWSVSTDNYLLSGYVLLRDGAPIATTTLTSFIDTGLIPETLYEYEVYAFDSFFNNSTTSNPLSTTTLAIPIVPPVATSTLEGGSSATLVFRLLGFDVTPSTNSALFTWRTSMPASYALRWGRSDAYNDGYIINDTYRMQQVTQISDLEPGTTYFYELTGYAANGRVLELRAGQFSTISRESLTPANVQNFTATPQGDSVRLVYQIPQTAIGARVRIVRSHLGYPLDPYDGAVIYEGTENSFFDVGSLQVYTTQYYTAFVIGDDGSVSSGAIAMARKALAPGTGEPTDPILAPSENPPLDLPIPEEPSIEIPDFTFSTESILLSQGEKSVTFKTENVELTSNESFSISITKDALPDSLKSIIVTLVDPKNPRQSYSFLLRINKEGTAYEAVIAPLLAVGPSLVTVEVFDYGRSMVGRYSKAVTFVENREVPGEVVFPDKLVNSIQPFFGTVSLLLLALLLLFFFLYRREKAIEDKH